MSEQAGVSEMVEREGNQNAHPHYHEGFYDAQDGEPLFPDATPPYQAGWRAFYLAKGALDAALS